MSRLRVIIVDDEPLARSRLQRLLANHADVDVVGAFADGGALLAAWRADLADLVLMDVRMPGKDGLAVASQLQPAPLLAFVTAYAEHAVQAFDVAAADYLVKPVDADRLDACLQRVRGRLLERASTGSQPMPPKRLALSLGRRTHLVDVDAIDCVVAQANYVELRAGGRCYLLRKPLHVIEAELAGGGFLRVHRSALVRVAAVREVELLDSGRYRLHLHDDSHLHSGRSYAALIRERFGRAGDFTTA